MALTGTLIKSGSQAENIPILKQEMDFMRTSIEQVYKSNGGLKKLGKSTRKIYESLSECIEKKLKDENNAITYKGSNGVDEQTSQKPGYKFLLDLFYTNKEAETMTCRQYNVDICYLYFTGSNRFDYGKSKDQKNKVNDIKVVEAQKNKARITISARRCCMSEVEALKNYLETQFNCIVEKHWIENNGVPLANLYNQSTSQWASDSSLVFHLLGLNYFQDKHCSKSLIETIKKYPDEFKGKSLIICLKDICEGEININSYAGKYKLSEFWNNELKFIEGTYTIKSNSKAPKKVNKKEIADIKNIRSLIIAVIDIIDFFENELVIFQYDHFLNYLMIDDLKSHFQKKFPSQFI